MNETKDWVTIEVEHINATVNTLTLNIEINETSQIIHKNKTGKDTKPRTTKSTEQNSNFSPDCVQPVEQSLTSRKTADAITQSISEQNSN